MLPRLKNPNRDALKDPKSFATTLLCLFIDVYGTEGLAWKPETIQLELENDFDLAIPQPNLDKLMSAIVLLTTNNFYRSLPDFIDLCNCLSGSMLNPELFDPADAYEMGWGITESAIISPPDEPFDEEILGYMLEALKEYGMTRAPQVFSPFIDANALAITQDETVEEDPLMVAAGFDSSVANAADIDEMVKRNLALLGEQLNNLQLTHGNVRDALMKVFRDKD